RSKPWSNPSGSSSSYGGNPLAAAAAGACLAIIDDEALVDNSRQVGGHLLRRMADWVERYPFVGYVRGTGLFVGIELVCDKPTKKPLAKSVCERIFHECLQRGLLTMTYTNQVRIQPALSIDEGTVDAALDILTEVFDLIDREGCWK
ncbi:MAG TPA: aminotransferase class III-fold pyridoxal phosphate-dependent enzyme, partial [Candidatus Polarisedimenticolaceae bacterium]|nr:aminotransferase class III-fold pyridoxal phosphate-dependent enzyme [Candidatus Polarisedimenticolaceae bacterium]